VFRQPVHDTLVVSGTAQALRFRSFHVDVRPAGAAPWDTLAQSSTPVTAGRLATLATRALPDGDYELRLAVQDTLGLTGIAQVTFIVDNVAPFAAQTTPALVSALNGGDVFTTNREAHVYIPATRTAARRNRVARSARRQYRARDAARRRRAMGARVRDRHRGRGTDERGGARHGRARPGRRWNVCAGRLAACVLRQSLGR
jgi:hypothetical protein